MNYKQLENAKNRYKFEVNVDAKEFEDERTKMVGILSKDVKISGFRPGKAPKDALEKEVGYKAYLEAINRILPKSALEVIEKENLNPISSFKYDLSDLDKDKNLTFTFEFVNQPIVKLEDFKKIKVEYKEQPIAKDEADMVIKNIIKSSLPREKWEKNIIETKKPAKKAAAKKSDEVDEHAGHNHGDQSEDITITDDLIAAIGYEDEKTYEGLKKRVEESLERVKKEDAENIFATEVINQAVAIADFDIPQDFVENEIEHKEEHFLERLKELHLEQDMYLKTQNTSLDDLRKEWKIEAEKNIKTDLLLINLGTSEKLIPSEKDVDEQIAKFEDPALKQRYSQPENRDYLKTSMLRDKALLTLLDTVRKDKKAA